MDQARAGRQPLQPFLEPDEDLVLDPRRVVCGVLERRNRARSGADRSLDLIERARQREPEKERDQPLMIGLSRSIRSA